MTGLGEKLRMLRESKGMGQKEVSELSGINYKTISNYENNRSEPDMENLAVLCRIYNVPADYLVNREFDQTERDNFFLHLPEQTHIKKYRALDGHGKEVIDIILEKEYARCVSKKAADTREIVRVPVAARRKGSSFKALDIRKEFDPGKLTNEEDF